MILMSPRSGRKKETFVATKKKILLLRTLMHKTFFRGGTTNEFLLASFLRTAGKEKGGTPLGWLAQLEEFIRATH